MTTRTITVNTPEETDVQICDECGLGDDHGELLSFSTDDPEVDDDLHYHRDCVREKNGNPHTLSEAYHDAVGADLEYQIAFVLTKLEFHIITIVFAAFIVSLGLAAFPVLGGSDLWVVMAGIAALLLSGIMYIGRDNGQQTAEEML